MNLVALGGLITMVLAVALAAYVTVKLANNEPYKCHSEDCETCFFPCGEQERKERIEH